MTFSKHPCPRLVQLAGVLALVSSICPVLASENTAVDVWAVGDYLRVSPVSGEVILTSKTKVHADYPTGSLKNNNLIWDSATNTVTLSAARNEFVAFQVILGTNRPVSGVDLQMSELQHPSGAKLDGKSLQILKQWYTQVRRPSLGYEASSLGAGWYPDALMPKRRSSLFPAFPFSIPDLYNGIANQTAQGIWIDIYVPFERSDAPPGRYEGEILVKWEGGNQRLKVQLQVWDFALPHESHLPGDFWNGSMRGMPLSEELAYYQMARRHRFLPLVYAYRPDLTIENGNVKIDWAAYDSRVGPYLDGSAFTEKHGYWGPGTGQPLHHVMLPFNVDSAKHPGGAWPISVPEEGRTAEYESVWKEVGRQFREHFDSKPAWQRTEKVAFLNGLDESYFESAYEEMLYYGKLLHDGMGRDWFLYRIDGGYSKEAMEKLSREIDLWVCHTVSFDLPTVKHFQRKGLEVWFYGPMIYEQRRNSGCGSNTFLDLDLNVNRAIGWIGWKYKTGWVEWEVDGNAFSMWYDAENFKDEKRYDNGSGQLIYRGAVMHYNQPIASIRLKSTRRGLQDHEYFWLLSQLSGADKDADQLVNSVIYKNPFGESAMLDTEIWKNDPTEWEKVRLAVGKKIAELIH